MNYQAYFTNANQLGITFEQAFNMLSSFLNVMSTLEQDLLFEQCEQYKWNLPVVTDEVIEDIHEWEEDPLDIDPNFGSDLW